MTTTKTFNGHKNYNHWNVSLWINNDESLYQLALESIKSTNTRDKAVERMLRLLGTHTPDGARYSKSSVRAAMVGM